MLQANQEQHRQRCDHRARLQEDLGHDGDKVCEGGQEVDPVLQESLEEHRQRRDHRERPPDDLGRDGD